MRGDTKNESRLLRACGALAIRARPVHCDRAFIVDFS